MLDFRGKKIAHWLMTTACNYDCDYCYGHGHNKGSAHINVDVNDVIRRLDEAGGDWCVDLVGGEVFLVPGFVDICQALTSKGFPLHLETNMSVGPVLNEFMARIDPSMVIRLGVSLHIEERERREAGIDRFVAYVAQFRERGFRVDVNYVMHPRLFDRLDQDVERFRELGIAIEPHPFVGVWKYKLYPDAYTRPERGRILALNSNAGYARNIPSKGSLCKAGMTFVDIGLNGEIHRCVGVQDDLGNIATGMHLFTEPQPCPRLECPCWGQQLIVDRKIVDAAVASFARPTAKQWMQSRLYPLQALGKRTRRIMKRVGL
jgi:MoaA/NifB/PqqE/SkfB family radical SAM enzyme